MKGIITFVKANVTASIVGGIIILLLIFAAFNGIGRSIELYKEHKFDKAEAERMKKVDDLLQQNDLLRKEIGDLKTQRAAQEEIIKQKGGDIALQQQKIEEAQKQFEADEALSQQATDDHTRCERLKQKFINLKVRGAENIDCNKAIQ